MEVLAAARARDWSFLPWSLMGAGIFLCVFALLITRYYETEPEGGRLMLLTVGLLAAGIAIAIRLNTGARAFLDRVMGPSRTLLLTVLATVFVLVAAAALAIFVATFFELPDFPWGTGTAFYMCVVVIPLGLAAAARTRRLYREGRAITPAEESALLLLGAASCCFIACWALYLPGDRRSWDTIRLALAAGVAAALLGAPLVLASTRVRRWTVSVLVVMHLSAIAAATLSAPPTPPLIEQLWKRIYRPYLEFMYLNNAYHFYAPEPGPASYLWCRLIYSNDQGEVLGDWLKVPRIDEVTGQPQHPVALEYQRHLALVENIVPYDATSFIINENTQKLAPYFEARQRCTLDHEIFAKNTAPIIIPFHPYLSLSQQYVRLNDSSKRLVSSFARHLARTRPELTGHPGFELKVVKMYRVRHDLPTVEDYAKADPPIPANHPALYRAFYLGEYDPDGVLQDGPPLGQPDGTPRDPFLYWVLPIFRGLATHAVYDYCRLHAGDDKWIRPPDSTKWVNTADGRKFMKKDNIPDPHR
jgi:hypothetical protein